MRLSRRYRLAIPCAIIFSFTFPCRASSVQSPSQTRLEACMIQAMKTALPETTIGALKKDCNDKIAAEDRLEQTEKRGLFGCKQESAFSKRLKEDKKNTLRPFTLMAHKPNYIMFATYNNSGFDSSLYQIRYNNSDFTTKKVESQFQLSYKFPLVVNLFNTSIDIYAAYTNLSFWQLYNDELSSPFRETNHEPEAWVQFNPEGFKMLKTYEKVLAKYGVKNTLNRIGFVHQSNGQGGVLSRSWNRFYVSMLFERNNFTFSLKPWVRVPEKRENDDNPDITDYLGHMHARLGYKCGQNTFSLMLRNNLESGFKRGAIEVGWSFPLWRYNFIKGYISAFSGYGQSLIDYDHYVNGIGFGVILTDIL